MLTEYISKQLERAHYKILEDETIFGEIPGIKGVWANAPTLEACRRELQEVLEDWLVLKVRLGETIPDFKINIDQRNLVKHA